MKKDMPTLADAMIATGLDKHMAGGPGPDNAQLRKMFLSVANARKFVLDYSMSRFLMQIEQNLIVGGLRKRFYAIENARMMARLPHDFIFIEFDFQAYQDQATKLGMKIVRNPNALQDEPLPAKFGMLMRRHRQYENVFMSTEVSASVLKPGRAWIHPVSMAWTTDSSPLPIPTMRLYEDEDDQSLLVMLRGYKTKCAGWGVTFGGDLSIKMMREIGAWSLKPGMTARAIWGLLATINDLPVQIEYVEPSHGYMARGNYKKFLKHSIVHLTVPEIRWRKVIAKAQALLRRRAHQVRGHWRKDWRNPLVILCEHEFNDEMTCKKCGGRKLWIAEHQRGDASLGFVTHDYEVSKRSVDAQHES